MKRSKTTFKQAFAVLRAAGLRLSKLDDQGHIMDDYRVSWPGPRSSTEASAYYTPDLDDAVSTGLAMVAQYQRTGVLAVHQRSKEACHA